MLGRVAGGRVGPVHEADDLWLRLTGGEADHRMRGPGTSQSEQHLLDGIQNFGLDPEGTVEAE